MPLSSLTAERFARGRALFNSGHYFEAHEAWEDAWREEKGAVRRTLHGLIQVAAGYHKATRQNQPGGCVRLLEAGLEKLRGVPEDSCGYAIGVFRRAVEVSLAEAKRWREHERPPLERECLARLETVTAGPGSTG